MTTCKFGGSCTTNAKNLSNIKNILKNKKRKIIIFSAIGKIKKKNNKLTDYLFEFYEQKSILQKNIILNKIKKIFYFLKIKTGSKINLNYYLNKIKNSKDKGYIVSRGEDLTARMMADFLSIKYVPAEKLFFLKNGVCDEAITKLRIKKFLKMYHRFCTGGFYGTDVDTGRIVLLERGGGDVSGALFAKLSHSKIYENYTDVDGVKMANPNLVPYAETIGKISYDDVLTICRADGKVLHQDVCQILRDTNVTTIVKNLSNLKGRNTKINKRKHTCKFVCCQTVKDEAIFFVKHKKWMEKICVSCHQVQETYRVLYNEIIGE